MKKRTKEKYMKELNELAETKAKLIQGHTSRIFLQFANESLKIQEKYLKGDIIHEHELRKGQKKGIQDQEKI